MVIGLCWTSCCMGLLCLAGVAAPVHGQGTTTSPAPPETHQFNTTTNALEAMMTYYNSSSGLWNANGSNPPWWQSAIALQAIIDWTQYASATEYLVEAYNTVEMQKNVLPWWPEGQGHFRADSTDDTAWWALALLSLYELTDDGSFLDMAKEDEAYIFKYWSSDCNGGVIWDIPTLSYKNAVSNELYMELTARLYNLPPHDEYYLNQSLMVWQWFQNSGMINSQDLINDGLTKPFNNDTCVNNNAQVWTYNQGIILGALVELYEATSDKTYLYKAQQIADGVMNDSELTPNGILTEHCPTVNDCDPDGWAFKGIFMRYLSKLDAVLDGSPYKSWIQQNANELVDKASNGLNYYGSQWQGPFDSSGLAKQESAVMLLMAAL